MENTKTNYQFLHSDGNWYPIEIRKCSTTRARGTVNQGRPYQPVYIKNGREYPIRYRRPTIEAAIAELQSVLEHDDGTCNSKRYRLNTDDVDTPMPSPILRLFVYGTLKCGYWNHSRFCRNAISIEDATVRGRLYELPLGIPVLEVPEEDVLATGTINPAKDVALQDELASTRLVSSDLGDWHPIQGELITLSDPNTTLPPIDRLEGFIPQGHCMYLRVLTRVTTSSDSSVLAWCYVGTPCILRDSHLTRKCSWP